MLIPGIVVIELDSVYSVLIRGVNGYVDIFTNAGARCINGESGVGTSRGGGKDYCILWGGRFGSYPGYEVGENTQVGIPDGLNFGNKSNSNQ